VDGDVCRCRKRYPTGPPGASVEKGFWVLCLESAASMLYSFFRRGKRSAKIKKDITQTNEECGCRSKRRRRHPWCQRGPNQRNVVCHRRCCTGLRRRTRGRMIVALPLLNMSAMLYCLGDVGEYDGLVGDHFGDEAEYGAEPGEVGEYLGDVGE
jgi:hypothetical protein